MTYYINTASSFDSLGHEVKELIPAPEMRRRMSRVSKMAVSTGMDALAGLPEDTHVAAIITATRLGCLTDSERFLRGVIERDGDENDTTTPPPTPFIQSTFNTVGGQIALLTGNHCYNMTYVHGSCSFESAVLDAMIQIDQAAAQHVLVGAFDETTPSLSAITRRMRSVGNLPEEDGAWFFVISSHPLEGGCLGELRGEEYKISARGLWERLKCSRS